MDPEKPFGLARRILDTTRSPARTGRRVQSGDQSSTAGRIRHDLVTDIREQIAGGTYPTKSMLKAALSRVIGFVNVGSPKCPECEHPLDPRGGSEFTCRECGSVFHRRDAA